MELSLFYFAIIPFILLCAADPTEFDLQCPSSRRLLSIGGYKSLIDDRKSHRISSSSKLSTSSPPKYARSSESHGLTVYIRPQTSKALGHKVRSYAHLLQSKTNSKEDKSKSKRSQASTKKKETKQKPSTEHKSSKTTKTQQLVASKEDEIHRCEALLRIDAIPKIDHKVEKTKPIKSTEKPQKLPEKLTEKSQKLPEKTSKLPEKPPKSPKVKNATNEISKNTTKKVATINKSVSTDDKKIKDAKVNSKINPDEKKKAKKPLVDKESENVPLTPTTTAKPSKKTTPPSTSPSPPVQPSTTKKTKSEKDESETLNTINETTESSTADDNENPSVVGRAFHFVKNVFQLSDDMLSDNLTHENILIDLPSEQQEYQSRKLLSIDDNQSDDESDFYLNDKTLDLTTGDDLSFVVASTSNRHLLSVKTNKQSGSSKANDEKEKNSDSTTSTVIKPRVGWAYRYRVSRYYDAQKMQRSTNKNKASGEGKSKHSQQRQSNSKDNDKHGSKRKILEYNGEQDSSWDNKELSNQNIVDTVTITESFVPKRQLLKSKRKDKIEDASNSDEDDDTDTKLNVRRMKSLEESTDPILIVQSYDRGIFKPRVGWQFRYRVSRYIDSLRQNIREDQERLKLGLQAIKRKTPQEISGKRKRVLDKPVASSEDESKKQEDLTKTTEEDKPNVGWRYRYRIKKMNEAKKRGEYVDDEDEKRKLRLKEKTKPISPIKQDDEEKFIGEDDLDPELRQITAEGRRVGWAYRYRVRRKLDFLKQQKAEKGIDFDLATLTTEFDRKVAPPESKPNETNVIEPIEEPPKNKTKSVGWQYRYRVSKMQEALKHNKSKTSKSKKQGQKIRQDKSDTDLTKLTPDERTVGWQYRYRIRRKIDSLKDAANRQDQSLSKKSSSKRKKKSNVKESIEQILNIDDINETPFMEYFRRTSSHILFNLLPAAKKSICFLPVPMTFSFCEKEDDEKIRDKRTKEPRVRKLKMKKENRAKQFIRSHRTRLGAADKATERRIDEAMRKLYKTPSLPPPQTPVKPEPSEKPKKKERKNQQKRPNYNEQVKHFHDEHSVKKKIGVETKKNKNKKKFQLLGKRIKTKSKHDKLRICPFATGSPVKTPTTTSPPPPPARLRTISELIQEEAKLFQGTHKSSSTFERINDEIEEVNEIIQERSKLKATTTTSTSTPSDDTISNNEDHSASSSSNIETNKKNNEENIKETLDLEHVHNSL